MIWKPCESLCLSFFVHTDLCTEKHNFKAKFQEIKRVKPKPSVQSTSPLTACVLSYTVNNFSYIGFCLTCSLVVARVLMQFCFSNMLFSLLFECQVTRHIWDSPGYESLYQRHRELEDKNESKATSHDFPVLFCVRFAG